jgi:hypothetical protein
LRKTFFLICKVSGSSFPSGGIQRACNFSNVEECFSSCWEIQRLSLRKCVEETSSKCCKFSSVKECFSTWEIQRLGLRKCVEETSSSCCELQCWSLRKCAREVFQVVESFKFQVRSCNISKIFNFKLLWVAMLKFEKVCGRDFFRLLRVAMFKFDKVCKRGFSSC